MLLPTKIEHSPDMTTTPHAYEIEIAGSGSHELQTAIRTDAALSPRTPRRSAITELVKWVVGAALIVGVMADTWSQP